MRRLLLFPLLAACSAPEPRVSEEQVVIGTARPAGKPKQTPEWFEGQIAAAWEELRTGRLEDGLKRVVYARAQNPEGEDLEELDELVRRLNRAVLDLPTLSVAVEPDKDPIVFGDPVRIRVRIANAGPRTVRVRARPPKGSPTIFVFDVVRTEVDIRAQRVQSRLQVHYPLRKDLELPPRATVEIWVTLAGAGNDRPLDGIRTFTVGGHLRAGAIELDGLRRYEAVRIEAGTLRSFRPNWEHLASDPVARVRQAFERSAPLHLLTAVALVPAHARGTAVDALVEGLTGAGPMDLCAFGCLEILTNVELGRDADAWRAWWARVRDRFFAPEGEGASGDREGEKPRFSVPR